jgi:hypothetical protein
LYRSWNTGTSCLAGAILSFWFPVLIWSFYDSSFEFPEPKNMQIAVGISLLSCIEAEIQALSVLAAVILSFRLPVSRSSPSVSIIDFPDLKNMQVAVGVSSLSGLEAEI